MPSADSAREVLTVGATDGGGQLIGVATSQVTFWTSLGGTMDTAVLGSILTNHLPVPPSRIGLATTLHERFLVAALVAVVSVVAALAMREVPHTRQAETLPEYVEVAA